MLRMLERQVNLLAFAGVGSKFAKFVDTMFQSLFVAWRPVAQAN